jgi:hypothetical protein
LLKIERYGLQSFGHTFRMEKLKDFDSDFMKLIREAYKVGQQKFL